MASGQSNLINILQERVARLFSEGKFEEALRVSQTALDSARRAVGSESEDAMPQLITALETLGDLRRHQGDFASSQALYREALEHAEIEPTPADQVAQIESSLAILYDFNGLEEQAAPLYEHAIELYESLDPPLIVEAANLRNNVGMIYKGLGEFEPAEEHYIRALSVFEAEYGRSNEEVAAVYNNLGALYYQSELPEQALEMHLSAVEIRRDLFGDRHPDVGQSYSNIALVCYELGDEDGAERYLAAAMTVLEPFIPEDPGSYEIAVGNYVDLLRSRGLEKRAASVSKKCQKLLRKSGVQTTTLLTS